MKKIGVWLSNFFAILQCLTLIPLCLAFLVVFFLRYLKENIHEWPMSLLCYVMNKVYKPEEAPHLEESEQV